MENDHARLPVAKLRHETAGPRGLWSTCKTEPSAYSAVVSSCGRPRSSRPGPVFCRQFFCLNPSCALSQSIELSRAWSSERESNFQLFVLQRRDRLGLDQRLVGCNALAPGRDGTLAVVTLQVLPIGNDEIAVPLVKIVDPRLMKQLHAEARGLVFIIVKDLNEDLAVLRILERAQLFCEGRRDPLDTVSEKVQQNEALHFEVHIRIQREPQPVEDTGARRLQVAIFNREAIFHDLRGDPQPDIHT